jgi:3-oxoacyl-[acyl-carrier-protein] synthase III
LVIKNPNPRRRIKQDGFFIKETKAFIMPNSIITASGCYIPTRKIANAYFMDHDFYGADRKKLARPNAEIVAKFQEITGIQERRYVTDDLNTSDIAFQAAERALEGTDRESLDYIIVAHNFGEIRADDHRCDMVPSIAARVKHKLQIKNPYTVAYDILFGCPGWLQGMIVADYYIRSGDARKVLVIGTETLSRVSDPHDIDHMIYSDGAGATLLEGTEINAGILSHVSRSDTHQEAYLLWFDQSYHPESHGDRQFLKMHGHDVYKYAVKTVADTVKKCLESRNVWTRPGFPYPRSRSS